MSLGEKGGRFDRPVTKLVGLNKKERKVFGKKDGRGKDRRGRGCMVGERVGRVDVPMYGRGLPKCRATGREKGEDVEDRGVRKRTPLSSENLWGRRNN